MNVSDMDGVYDHYDTLLHRETFYPCSDNYLSKVRAPSSSRMEDCRSTLCQWCFNIVDHFHFSRDVVSIAMNYLDRISSKKSKSSDISLKEYQLYALSSLYLAIKTHGLNDSPGNVRRRIKIETFQHTSRNKFSVDSIAATEMEILLELNWHVNPPTYVDFINDLLHLCPAWQEGPNEAPSYHGVLGHIFDASRYMNELALMHPECAFHYKTSEHAFSAILCALCIIDSVRIPFYVRDCFIDNLIQATGLSPESPRVQALNGLLMQLCPNLFQFDTTTETETASDTERSAVSSPSKERDNESPVGVADLADVQDSDRKRPRE